MKTRLIGLSLLFFVLLSAMPLWAEDSAAVHFVQITDTHFGRGNNYNLARKAVEEINALPMDIRFVVVTGDIMHDLIADTNAVNEALGILDGLKVPVHFVPGNHDFQSDETFSIYTNRFAPLLSSAEYGGIEFVFVYTEPIANGVSGNGYRSNLMEEFDGLLQKLPAGQPVIVFHHRPSIGWSRSPEAAERWQELLNHYKVKAVIAGHFHSAQMHWLGDVPLYVGPSLAVGKGFLVYKYSAGKIECIPQNGQ